MSPTVPIEANLDAVVEILATDQVARVTVLDADNRVVGVVAASDVILAYRQSLEESLRRLGSAFRGSRLLEEEVHAGGKAEGRTVSDDDWPAGTIVVAVQRGGQLIFPHPDTQLEAGDVVSLLAPAGKEDQLRLETRGPSVDEETDDDTMI